ncbi:MAG TPA: fibronectin type III domain-containing protein, partial [Mycobacteriales bacterium]|nr:fibronectin type III domain-containing protein [Mycobacteriales bacterium]
LAGTGAGDFDPEWSADGSKIAYSHLGAQIGSTESYPFDEYVSNADGSGSATKVTTVAGVKQFDASFHWAKDGQSLLGAASFGGRPGLWRLPVDTDAGVEPELVDDGATGGTPQWASAMIPGSYVASSFPLTLAGGTPAQAFHVSAANEQTSHNSLDEIGITISNTTDLTAAQVHLTYDSGDGPQAVSLSDGAGGTITGTIELPGGIPAEAVRTTPMTVSLDAGASAQSLHVELMRLGDSDPENPVSEQGSEIVAATPTTTALDAPATAHSGAPVMLTATVDPSAATGTVTFYDGATPIGAPVTVTGGTAATTTSTLTNGQHTIEAVYSGAVATDTDPAYASSTSPTRSITIAGLPGAPGVTAQRGNDSAVITVTAPASDGGAAIDQYTITLTPGPITRTLTAPGTTTVSGLTNGVTYAVSATAHNSVGDGPAGTTSVTPAAVPDAPVASSVTAGNGRITLAFSTPASNGSPITGYTVTATPLDAASGSARKVTGTGSPVTVTGLTNGAAYSLVVHATNAIGDGPDSAPIVGVAGIAQGVSLLLSHNPVPVGHPLQFYGYVVDHSVPLPHTAVVLQQRLSKTKTNSLATVTTDAQGRFTYSLRLVHTGAVRAHAQIEGKTSYSKELLAKIAFVLLKVKAVISHGHVVITGFITPGSPSPFGEAPDRVAIYRSNAKGVKLAYIGDAKLTKTAKGAAKTGFTYDHKASVLAGSTYVYVNPLGTRANWSTHTTVRVT